MNSSVIKQIEEALTHHINYAGHSTGMYLKIMDRLAFNYTGAPAIKVSKLLNDYFKEVNVKTLDEAIKRLKGINND